MSAQNQLGPEIQAILESVASDPRSRLLRVPKLHVPLRYETPVMDREALITGVERQLIKEHRFSVADLLLQEVRRATSEWEASRDQLSKYVITDQEPELPDPVEWKNAARLRLSATSDDEAWTQDATSLLAKCVQTTPNERPSPVQLAAASLRLVPRASTRICLGLALHQAGQSHSGLEVLWDVLGNRPPSNLRPYAWHNIGYLERCLGHGSAALKGYREAALAADYRGDSAMRWFLEALVRGDREEMLRCGHYMADAAPLGGASIDSLAEMYLRQAHREGWRLDGDEHRAFSAIADRLPEQLWSLGNALSKNALSKND